MTKFGMKRKFYVHNTFKMSRRKVNHHLQTWNFKSLNPLQPQFSLFLQKGGGKSFEEFFNFPLVNCPVTESFSHSTLTTTEAWPHFGPAPDTSHWSRQVMRSATVWLRAKKAASEECWMTFPAVSATDKSWVNLVMGPGCL